MGICYHGKGKGAAAAKASMAGPEPDWTRGTVDQDLMSKFVSTLASDIATHTPEQNARMQANIEHGLEKEMEVARAYRTYRALNYITGPADPWWTGHQQTLGTLRAELEAVKAERKRQGR